MVSIDNPGTSERSLYECFHARVKGNRIYCEKGYHFKGQGRQNGSLDIERLARGEPLIMSVCQKCVDFESVGDPVPAQQRGWLKNTAAQQRRYGWWSNSIRRTRESRTARSRLVADR